jgi:peptide/nickel transport system substrate-binding protein
LRAAQQTFDPAAFDQAMAKVNELMVDDAAALILAHGLSPWGMSAKVKDFILPRNWFVNLTSVSSS